MKAEQRKAVSALPAIAHELVLAAGVWFLPGLREAAYGVPSFPRALLSRPPPRLSRHSFLHHIKVHMISSWWRKICGNGLAATGRPLAAAARVGQGGTPNAGRCWKNSRIALFPRAISMPTNLTASRGWIVSVPIDVDTLNGPANGNSGLSGADFVVFYDTSVFSVSASDFGLGTISTNGSTAAGNGYSPWVQMVGI